jgi:hypothetical protein
MNRIGFLTLLVFCLFITPALSQKATKQATPSDKDRAVMQIRQLKQNALIVRLQMREQTTEQLRQAGNAEAATKLQLEQEKKNKEIIAAFRSDFTFCPVYFIDGAQSELLTRKEWDKIVFLNAEGREDSTIRYSYPLFFTGEFTSMDQNISALIIADENFVRLPDPFPSHVNAYSELSENRPVSKSVRKLNSELHDYFKFYSR